MVSVVIRVSVRVVGGLDGRYFPAVPAEPKIEADATSNNETRVFPCSSPATSLCLNHPRHWRSPPELGS